MVGNSTWFRRAPRHYLDQRRSVLVLVQRAADYRRLLIRHPTQPRCSNKRRKVNQQMHALTKGLKKNTEITADRYRHSPALRRPVSPDETRLFEGKSVDTAR